MITCTAKKAGWKKYRRERLLITCEGKEKLAQIITSQISWEEYDDTIFEHTRNLADSPDIEGLNTKVILPDGTQVLIVAETGTRPYFIKMFEEGDKVFHTIKLST